MRTAPTVATATRPTRSTATRPTVATPTARTVATATRPTRSTATRPTVATQTAPTARSRVPVLDMLSGDAQTFLAKIWASRVHVHHAPPEELVGYLSFDDVDRLLTSTAIRTPAVRLAKDGNVLPASTYTRHATLAGAPMTG